MCDKGNGFLKLAACTLISAAISATAAAQQVNRLQCSGELYGRQAALAGVRLFRPTPSPGGGYAFFNGQVSAAGLTANMHYEGYFESSPYKGVIAGPLGTVRVGVLDQAEGRFWIYDDTPRMGPPDTIGVFVCDWR